MMTADVKDSQVSIPSHQGNCYAVKCLSGMEEKLRKLVHPLSLGNPTLKLFANMYRCEFDDVYSNTQIYGSESLITPSKP